MCAEIGEAACSCTGSPVVYCHRCAQLHLQGPGVHDCQALHLLTCLGCQQNPADEVCLCQYPLIPLCSGCSQRHVHDRQGGDHYRESLLVGFIIRNEEDRIRYIGRSSVLNRIEKVLKDNLQAVETCKQGVEKTTQGLIMELSNWLQRKTRELDKIEADLHVQLAHLLDTIKVSRLAKLNAVSLFDPFLQAPVDVAEKLTVFRHSTIRVPEIRLEDAVMWTYDPSKLVSILKQPDSRITGLPLVFYRHLRLFALSDFIEHQVKLQSKVHINDGSSLCHLPNGLVFACGGEYPVHALVYVINSGDGAVTQQREMLVARRFPGVVSGEGIVWIFGGNDGKRGLAASEVYTLHANRSASIPDMLSPREKFSPCLWQDKVVLAGGLGTTTIEIYDITRKIYEGLPLRLPASDCTISLLRGDDLVILQANQLLVCSLTSPKLDVQSHIPTGSWWSNIQPVRHRGYYYFFRLDYSLLFDRGLVDVLVSSFKKVVNIHRASLYSLEIENLRLTELRDIHY